MDEGSRLAAIRGVRRGYSWGLMGWSVGSVGVGFVAWWVLKARPDGGAFWGAFWSQQWIWGAIDLVFAGLGVWQAVRADRTPVSAVALEGETAEARKLLGSLAFSHKLNWVWVGTGVALLAWGAVAGGGASASLLGHGTGVLVQGGFLFVYDRLFDRAVRRVVGEGGL